MPDPAGPPWPLRLYPRAWRDRYGDEVSAILSSEPMTPRLVLDLIAGAIDARVSPQSVVAFHQGREKPMKGTFACGVDPAISFHDHVKAAVWIVIGTAALTWLSIGLREAFGRTLPIVTLNYAAFPLALLWSSRWTTMKPYSRAAQAVILGTTALVVLAICALAASIGHRF